MQDLLTKYSVAVPLPNQRADSIARAFIEEFIYKFGCPRAILTNQGPNFTGLIMKLISKAFQIRTFKTTSELSPSE